MNFWDSVDFIAILIFHFVEKCVHFHENHFSPSFSPRIVGAHSLRCFNDTFHLGMWKAIINLKSVMHMKRVNIFDLVCCFFRTVSKDLLAILPAFLSFFCCMPLEPSYEGFQPICCRIGCCFFLSYFIPCENERSSASFIHRILFGH